MKGAHGRTDRREGPISGTSRPVFADLLGVCLIAPFLGGTVIKLDLADRQESCQVFRFLPAGRQALTVGSPLPMVLAEPPVGQPRSAFSIGRRPITPRTPRRASRPPSLNTVWEYHADAVDELPLQEDALQDGEPSDFEAMRGALALRAGPSWLPPRLLGRRAWVSRYGVLRAAGAGSSAPRLLLFRSSDMEQLQEEVLLLAPLSIQCLPPDGAHHAFPRFTLSSGGAPPIELGAQSDDAMQRWVLALGESMSKPAACRDAGESTSAPPTPTSPALLGLAAPSHRRATHGGRVHIVKCKVSDHYRLGRVLSQDDDVLLVEGLHRKTHRSHALKLLSKDSNRLRTNAQRAHTRACAHQLGRCVEEVYEGPNHVCIVMAWGMHHLDAEHQIASSVLDALRLLREVLPHAKLPSEGYMLRKADAQLLMLRALALDCHLQSHLFI